MKTQVEKFREKQAQNNRIMFIVIMVCGLLLFVATGFAGFKENARVTNDNTNYVPLNTIAATFNYSINGMLEVDKLRQVMLDRQEQMYRTAMNGLADIEEPGLLFQDIATVNAFQEAYFNEHNDESYTVRTNTYLDALYRQKNDQVFAELENQHRFEALLAEENETELEIEEWMTDNSAWNYLKEANNNFDEFLEAMLAEKNRDVFETIERKAWFNKMLAFETENSLEMESWMTQDISPSATETGITKNHYLLGLLAEKNEAVFRSIELQCKCKKFLARVEEEPLEVEEWMVDERCWCPNKKQGEHLYTEPYAMKTK